MNNLEYYQKLIVDNPNNITIGKGNTAGKVDKILGLKPENFIRFILADLISGQDIDLKNINFKEIIKKFNFSFLEHIYPGINLHIKKEIDRLVREANEAKIDSKTYLKFQLLNNPESFISGILKNIGLDYDDIKESTGLEKGENVLLDIPPQARAAISAKVPAQYNATVGILKDENSDIVVNPKVKELLLGFSKETLGIDGDSVDSVVNYQKGEGIDIYKFAMSKLIKFEEEQYNWPDIKGVVSEPYFIPGGGGGLTVFRDHFLSEGDLVVVPNYRWPNIDGILTNKTKIPPAQIDLIMRDGSLNLKNIDNILETAKKQGRRKVSFYFNFPNNPSGVRLSEDDAKGINYIFKKHEDDINIQVVLDDPYGAFSIDNSDKKVLKTISESEIGTEIIIGENKYTCTGIDSWYGVGGDTLTKNNLLEKYIPKITAPLSYYLDTSSGKITVIEVGSHGTKEAGVYGLRVGVLRFFTNQNKLKEINLKISKAIRQDFSMSPSIPQILLTKAILGNDIDLGKNIDELKELPIKKINERVLEYIKGRTKMLSVIYPKLEKMKEEIIKQCGDYLIPMENMQDGESETGGFVINFVLTEKAKTEGIDLTGLQQNCINGNSINKCAFTVFGDDINGEKSMRISLISGNPEEYARRIKIGINNLVGNN